MVASATTVSHKLCVPGTQKRRRAAASPLRAIPIPKEEEDYVTASPTASPTGRTKSDIYALAACTKRGEFSTSKQRERMRALIESLANPTKDPAVDPALIGTWELVYESSGYPFRSSPFFWAVGKLLGEQADFFYSAHDHQTSIFGGGCGACLQRIGAGTLESDCVVQASLGVPLIGFSPIFAGFGSVITKGTTRTVDGDTIGMTLASLSTTVRQDDASVLPALNFLNGTTVPVGEVMNRITDGSSEVKMRITYLDDELRISQLEDGTQLVYRRVEAE